HGFCVISEEADFFYKCTDYYHPQSERGIAWDDPGIGIDWPLRDVSLSGKDQQNRRLTEQAVEDLPVYEG
ncbi:MAG: dTDP-4-dehydrorhamnose 3,5-epimerase family protein, partial [Candidatus Competibacteraceae bacterium]|nr:dTDP-4-dehydrorhamnose 3,5-epimerase family protein [Candidatus Competibacteraceae bacterium]